ncbi:MAG: hypothetical protein J0L92_26045 [Deltaproteobacteria bacterium]|nr:hypothetical protein [Deltaproteobacteria bacterium]
MHRGPGWVAFTRGPIAYMRIHGALTREAVDATRRLQLEGLASRPAGMGFLLDASGEVVLPSADVRSYAAQMAAKHSDGLAVHVTILEETGFRASALRSALTGIFFLARTPYPRHVVGDLESARDRLTAVLGDDVPPLASMRGEVEALRRAFSTAS